MNDLEYVREMLARANARYQIAVTNEVTIITVFGRRDDDTMPAQGVELQFEPDGTFRRAQR